MESQKLRKTTITRIGYIKESYKDWLIEGENVLDVGLGTGIVAKALINEFNLNLIGADIKNFLKTDVKFVKISDDKFPFEDKHFDCVMFNDALHHAKDTIALLKEAKRVSKKVLIFEDLPTLRFFILDFLINIVDYRVFEVEKRARKEKKWIELFQKLDFKNIKVKKIKRVWWYPLDHIAFSLES